MHQFQNMTGISVKIEIKSRHEQKNNIGNTLGINFLVDCFTNIIPVFYKKKNIFSVWCQDYMYLNSVNHNALMSNLCIPAHDYIIVFSFTKERQKFKKKLCYR